MEDAEAEEVVSVCWRCGKRGIAIKSCPEKVETVLFPTLLGEQKLLVWDR